LARIGHSIFIYEVEADGSPVGLSLGGLKLRDLALSDFDRLESNDLTPRWFDPQTSLLLPAQQPAWLALANGPSAFERSLNQIAEPGASMPGYTLYRLFDDWPALIQGEADMMPEPGGRHLRLGDGEVELLGAQPATFESSPNGETTLNVVTIWRQLGPPQPLKLFVHLRDKTGEIISQWDGLGGPWEGWREGDWWLHRHELLLPPEVDSGLYDLVIGLYDPASGARWQDDAGDDHILLQEVVIP
jgi:hypothetical protein